jgi:hypothetical protein
VAKVLLLPCPRRDRNRLQPHDVCMDLIRVEPWLISFRCRCGAEFCYTCGAEWSGRQCPNRCDLWREENLVRRAEQVVDRIAPANIAPAERQRRVIQAQGDVFQAQECDHRGHNMLRMVRSEHDPWSGYGTQFQCEMCGNVHRKFIFRCNGCQLNVCMDCRRHRVL